MTIVSERLGERICEFLAERELSRIEKEFQFDLRQRLTPGTSALILVVETDAPDKAVGAMSKFGGTVLASSLPEARESKLRKALHDPTSD